MYFGKNRCKGDRGTELAKGATVLSDEVLFLCGSEVSGSETEVKEWAAALWIKCRRKIMNNFIFENATKVYFGQGCVKEYLSCLSGHYGKKVMLCFGGGSIKENGIYEEVMASLKRAGKEVVEFAGIMANPTYAKVLEGAALAKEQKVDMILGVGGGSVMDCCKAISLATGSEMNGGAVITNEVLKVKTGSAASGLLPSHLS